MWSVSACAGAAQLSSAARRRLLTDLKKLQEEPIPLATAAPCSDDDMTLWNGVIGVNMELTDVGNITVPLHFLIDFPSDYPQKAPNIGFSFEFVYRGGAEYTMPDGRLKGKKVICLDVLGNFGGIHTEWASTVGSGWSPAYTVTTLLVQLQSVLSDLGESMTQRERDMTYQSALKFAEQNPSSMLKLLDDEDLRQLRERKLQAVGFSKLAGLSEALALRAQEFAVEAGFADQETLMASFRALLMQVGGSATVLVEGQAVAGPVVDANICCFSTGKLYTEALLGVGVSRAKNNLATAGELLSKEAFDGGLRQNTNKSPFEFFIPVWINAAHAEGSLAWRVALKTSYTEIGRAAYMCSEEDQAILEVFPRLINQLIVEMMRPDAPKSEAIATFEAMTNFWRTLRWLLDTRESLRKRVSDTLSAFVLREARRHKDVSPDLGILLVLYTVYQGLNGCPPRAAFMNAYADENSLRWVMWWQRSGTRSESAAVFEATKVSRDIAMFQVMVVDCVLGNVAETLAAIEASNCRLPERLEKLQALWRERKSTTNTWSKYFQHLGATMPAHRSVDAWIADCVRRAAEKGPKYGGAKGGDKGQGKSQGGKGTSAGKGK